MRFCGSCLNKKYELKEFITINETDIASSKHLSEE